MICSYICSCINQIFWMNSNELEVLSCIDNKFAIFYMTRDTRDIAVLLYSRCPWIILWWLWITLNTSNTINDSLYLSMTSEAKTQILSTNILLTCRTQKSCEPHLHLQFSRRRRPTIITRECSTDTSAEEIIYTGQTNANSIILHLSGIVPQTGHIHCFMRTSNRIS